MLKRFMYLFKHGFYRGMEEFDINLEELKKMQKKGAILIDVRAKKEFEEGHLDGAINIPEYEFNYKFRTLNISNNEIIVVYCSSGNRSKKACLKLKNMGYTNVYNLYGGLEEY